MPLVFREEAETDIREAFAWYRKNRPHRLPDLVDDLDAAFARLLEAPESHPLQHRTLRRLLLKKFPYGVYYSIVDDVIVVVAIYHAKRNPADLLEREKRTGAT